jgi:hypothetical protein
MNTEWLTIIKDISLIIAACVGSIVAIKGLNTWKIEQRGRVAFELARNLLANTYRLRDQVNNLRAPFMSAAEMKNPPDDSPFAKTDEGKYFYRQYSGYEGRLTPLSETRKKIFVDLAEAEALWGSNIRKEYNKLFSIINELVVEINMYLDQLNPEKPMFQNKLDYKDDLKRVRIMFGTGSEKDKYAKKINEVIESIKNCIQPHLQKQK